MDVEDAEEKSQVRDMAASGDVKILDSKVTTLSPADADDCDDNAKPSVLAWNTVVNLLADAEPMRAAGVAGILVILVLTIFGRVGSLVVGLLGGLLLHASLEKKRGGNNFSWLSKYTDEQTSDKKTVPREVLPIWDDSNSRRRWT
jgi:hypothetical protein